MPVLGSVRKMDQPCDLAYASLDWAITLLGRRDRSQPGLVLFVHESQQSLATDLMLRRARQVDADTEDLEVCIVDRTFLDCGRPGAWGVARRIGHEAIIPEFGAFLVWTEGA